MRKIVVCIGDACACWRERPLTDNFRCERERPELAALRPSRSTEFDALLPVAR